MTPRPLLIAWVTCWTIALALLIGAPARADAQVARTISNIAQLEWSQGGSTQRILSNTVNLTFSGLTDLTTSLPRDGLVPASLLATSCPNARNAPSSTPAAESPGLAALSIVPTRSIHAGQPIILSVSLAAANRSAAAIDTVRLLVQASSGDQEIVNFVETSPDSGTFVAIIESIGIGPAPISGDCRLSVPTSGHVAFDVALDPTSPMLADGGLDILVDPYGVAFDSRDGSAVGDVRITLIDVATGLPAQVFGDDGVSRYPSTVLTGRDVTDSGGTLYQYPTGDYRFPLVRPGTYRLLVEPVAPYAAPSQATPAELAALTRPGGGAFTITAGSYGAAFVLTAAGAVRIDIPLDPPTTALILSKTASRPIAASGDLIQYSVTVRNPDSRAAATSLYVIDHLPAQMRFRPGSARLDGQPLANPASDADRALRFALPALAAGAQARLTYVLEVRPNATAGDAINRAQAIAASGITSNVADAVVRIRRDEISDRLTIIGRVVDGGCAIDPKQARGVAGVRIMIEDGSYAVSDLDGRYHFEGLVPGTHVLQVDRGTLPARAVATDCAADVRSGGRATSRFVDGQGGMLKRVDFHLALASGLATAPVTPKALPVIEATDAAAAGAGVDWFAGQQPGTGFLYPTVDGNPRSPVTRVVIKHLPGQTVKLTAEGRGVDPITFEGVRKSADGAMAVSIWRGVPLADRVTLLHAEVRNGDGTIADKFDRSVTFANTAVRAELIRDRSSLVADGVHRPRLALRITDRDGHPVHHGMAGEFQLPEPYYPAMEADAQQARQLAGLERARPTWHVTGEDGIAFVELEPTSVSGTLSMRFQFRDGSAVREQRLEAWLDPGERPWTVVGLAEGTVGYNRLDRRMERLGKDSEKDLLDGRIALYAKGRVKGKWLTTLAYDSVKKRDESRFGGTIDPQRYYTIYADRSERRYDAASIRKLYLKLERPQFYALFGDFDTGIDEPVLARYVRSMNGVKSEYRSDRVAATLFAADTPLSHRREEIQGNGLSGPYTLTGRTLLANSERIAIETRDRFRSDRIVETRLLSRHIDYDIDYDRGTLVFRAPVLSRDSSANPQFIIADYEVDGVARRTLNAGGRVSWHSADHRLQVAATAIHDNDGSHATNLGGIDVRFQATRTTEIRAEAAASRATGATALSPRTRTAWLVEAEHHDGKLDLLAYARQQDGGFGLGQNNAVESGTRKVGLDARVHLNDALSLSGSAWQERRVGTGASRVAARGQAEYRHGALSGHAGLTIARDELADGSKTGSTLLNLGVSRQFFGNRLELGVDSELSLGGRDGSVDFPARHRFTGRFAVNRAVALVASYEIAKGDAVDARTARIGFDLTPWAGTRIALSGNVQDNVEFGRRSFAAFGLSQSVILSKRWSVDVTLDSNRTIGGIDPGRVINPLHPVASGGFVGAGGGVSEDFTAITAGATFRAGRVSITGRGEYRNADSERRRGLILGAIRTIGEGRALGGSVNWFRATATSGATSEVSSAQLTWANRPGNRRFTWLDKLEYRRDAVTNATPGATGPLGIPLLVSGDARSTRLLNSFTLNYSSPDNRLELSAFWGARFVSDKYGDDDVVGWSHILAAEGRVSVGRSIEIGGAASVRAGIGARALSFSAGPQISVKPFTNGSLMLGYNVTGYRDRDFAADRYTRSGPYATLRLKFDELSFAGLGLGRR